SAANRARAVLLPAGEGEGKVPGEPRRSLIVRYPLRADHASTADWFGVISCGRAEASNIHGWPVPPLGCRDRRFGGTPRLLGRAVLVRAWGVRHRQCSEVGSAAATRVRSGSG